MTPEETKQHLALASNCIAHFNKELKLEIDKGGNTKIPIQIILSYVFRIDARTDKRFSNLHNQFNAQILEELRKS